MCSVVGYIGAASSKEAVIEGLSRLEYRGYDSAGFSCLCFCGATLERTRTVGELAHLVDRLVHEPIDGHVGIGHTRWSTHGAASRENAHPHTDCSATIAIVHNGIIENHRALKEELTRKGHHFSSSTDSEVIAHLLEEYVAVYTLEEAMVRTVARLEGAYAFLVISQNFPDRLIAVRKGSPLCIGVGNDRMFAASDSMAFAGKVDKVIYLSDERIAYLRHGGVLVQDFSGNSVACTSEQLHVAWDAHGKGEFEHYMLKEIYEQKQAIITTVDYLVAMSDAIWGHLGLSGHAIQQMESLHVLACGTSWHAACISRFWFQEIVGIPTTVHLASEFKHEVIIDKKNCLYVGISQSGETADTLEALRRVKKNGQVAIVITNVASSTMAREADGFLLTQAGPEISVASTKAFSTQLTVLFWLAHRMADDRVVSDDDGILSKRAQQNLIATASILEQTIKKYHDPCIYQYAPIYAQCEKMVFLGRHLGYPCALEAALKLKEIAYIFAQAYPAGELKHGPLALVDDTLTVVVFSQQDSAVYQKLLANVQEVKARGGHVIAILFEGQDELSALADMSFIVPQCALLLEPLAMMGVMQLFVYALAKKRGCSIDKPRNLAKSVTVE